MYPLVPMRELASVIMGPLLFSFEKSGLVGEVLVNWKKANVTTISRKGKQVYLGNYRTVKFTSFPGKVME